MRINNVDKHSEADQEASHTETKIFKNDYDLLKNDLNINEY